MHVKGLKRIIEVKVPDRRTRNRMNYDILHGISLEEYNGKYPEFRTNVTQFNHYKLALQRGDRY